MCWNPSLDRCNIRLHIFLSSADQVSNRIPQVRCLRGIDVIVRKWVGPHCWAQIAVPLKTIGGQRGSFDRNSDWAGSSWGFGMSHQTGIHGKYTAAHIDLYNFKCRINHFIFCLYLLLLVKEKHAFWDTMKICNKLKKRDFGIKPVKALDYKLLHQNLALNFFRFAWSLCANVFIYGQRELSIKKENFITKNVLSRNIDTSA